jgi:hypothetical protein
MLRRLCATKIIWHYNDSKATLFAKLFSCCLPMVYSAVIFDSNEEPTWLKDAIAEQTDQRA